MSLGPRELSSVENMIEDVMYGNIGMGLGKNGVWLAGNVEICWLDFQLQIDVFFYIVHNFFVDLCEALDDFIKFEIKKFKSDIGKL